MQELEEEGLGGDVGGGGLTWQQNTQIIKLSFEAYRHGESRTHAELNLPYLQLHTSLVCRLQFGSLLQKMRMVEVAGSMLRTSWRPAWTSVPRFLSVQSRSTQRGLPIENWCQHEASWLNGNVHFCTDTVCCPSALRQELMFGVTAMKKCAWVHRYVFRAHFHSF